MILSRIDADLLWREMTVYPAVSDAGDSLYITSESADRLRHCLRPWLADESSKQQSSAPAGIEDMAALWLKEFGNTDGHIEDTEA